MVYFGGFFAKLGYSAGFSLNTINFAVYLCTSLSACLDFGDFSSNSELYNINMHGTLYFLGFFLYIIGRKDHRSCDGRGGALYFIAPVVK